MPLMAVKHRFKLNVSEQGTLSYSFLFEEHNNPGECMPP
jgi:hypothetical protein